MIKLRNFFRKSEAGFTLVELMVVIVILGVLSGVGVQQYGNVLESANDEVDDANRRILKGAAQMAILDNGGAPDSEDDTTNTNDNNVVWESLTDSNTYNGNDSDNWGASKYLESWPDNPNGDDYKVTIYGTDSDNPGTIEITP